MENDIMVFANGSIEYIQRDVDDIKQSFVRLGYHLWECSYYKYYEYIEVRQPADFGEVYKDVYDFAVDYFGLSRSTCSRLMSICTRFCNCTIYLLDAYRDYGYSQLIEMLSMDDDMLRCVRPSMSVMEIRRVKHLGSGVGVCVSACDVISSRVIDVLPVTVSLESLVAPGANDLDCALCDVAHGEPESGDDLSDLRDRVLAELTKMDRAGLLKLLSLISGLA